MLRGIDISAWQGDVDFESVSKSQDFVIIKATEGVGFKDSKFDTYRSELERLDIPHGFYHFARPDLNNTPEDEADWFLSVLGEGLEGRILILDFEVNIPDPVTWCLAFLDRISETLNGYRGMIYLNMFTVKSYDWLPLSSKNYSLYLAYWDYDPNGTFNVPHWDIVAMRQFSNNESIDGISGRVDGNVFYGDVEQFLAYGVGEGDIPCKKVILENEELKQENKRLVEENKALDESLKDLNTLYKKLLEEDKIEDEEMEQLLEDFDELEESYERQANRIVQLDELCQKLNDDCVNLVKENKRLKDQRFTLSESIVFVIRALKGGADNA